MMSLCKRDGDVLTPLVGRLAVPPGAEDEQLAVAGGQRALRQHVVREHDPPLQQLRVVGERGEDVERRAVGSRHAAGAERAAPPRPSRRAAAVRCEACAMMPRCLPSARSPARSAPSSRGAEPGHVVLDDDVAVAFLDRRPVFPGHVLVVPRDHVETLARPPGRPGRAASSSACSGSRLRCEDGLGADGSFVAMNNRVSQSVAAPPRARRAPTIGATGCAASSGPGGSISPVKPRRRGCPATGGAQTVRPNSARQASRPSMQMSSRRRASHVCRGSRRWTSRSPRPCRAPMCSPFGS